MHTCSIKIKLPSKHSSHIAEALKPEAGILPGKRSRAEVSVEDDGSLAIKIEAEDTTALRAAVNSFLRWYAAISRSIESVA